MEDYVLAKSVVAVVVPRVAPNKMSLEDKSQSYSRWSPTRVPAARARVVQFVDRKPFDDGNHSCATCPLLVAALDRLERPDQELNRLALAAPGMSVMVLSDLRPNRNHVPVRRIRGV